MHQPVAPASTTKRRRPKRWRAVLLAVLAVSAGVGVYFTQRGADPIAITTEKATVCDIIQVVSATGKIRPEVEVKISPEVAGEIIELPVIDGQHVKKGDLLVKIRPDNYIASVRQAEAGLSSAEADSLERKSQMLNE